MRAVLWVPGKFSLTNKMLDNLRAGSRYQGKHPPRGWVNAFEQETQAIRLATKVAARTQLVQPVKRLPDGVAWWVGFVVFGHHKHDRDAWYLLAKAALDGLVDAGALASDRRDVWGTRGAVLQTAAEEREAVGYLYPLPMVPPCAGLAIEMTARDLLGRGVCGHA